MSTNDKRVKMWFRVSEEQRRKINAAACLLGLNTTDFCSAVMTNEANIIIHERITQNEQTEVA